jgi:hypothetical protein
MNIKKQMMPVRFIIVTAGRTGSTRLRLLLDSHPLIRCHGEVFGENLSTLAAPNSSEMMQLIKERDADTRQFLINRALAPVDELHAIGFKILYSQLLERWPELDTYILSDEQIRIIHLRRRNGLKRFLSEYFVGTVTHIHSIHNDEPIPEIRPVVIPVEIIKDNIINYEKIFIKIKNMFKRHPYFEIDYEDSLDDNGQSLKLLQDFIGVPQARLSTNLRKILPDDPRALIANFDEISENLSGSAYKWMIGDLLKNS